MKKISLPFTVKCTPGHTDVVNLIEVTNNINELRTQAGKVVYSAASIELLIDDILTYTLFKENSEKFFLAGIILKSDWCTFSAKRKLLKSVIRKWNLLQDNDRNGLDKKLAEVMKYRNALTHGSIEYAGNGYVLKYFEGEPQTVTLDDNYWDEISIVFLESQKILSELYDSSMNNKTIKK